MDTCANEYENIYEDLGSESCNLGQELDKLQTDNHRLEQHVISLEGDIEKLTKVVVELKTTQKNLSNNISSLYRTAQAEIERKDRMITELRQKFDNIVFKRTDPNPTIKDSHVTANKKPKYDDSRAYNEGSGNNFQRKDNYKGRDRYSYDDKNSRTGNGRYDEKECRSSRGSQFKKRTRESPNEYDKKHKQSRRKPSNESIGRSDECRKTKQGYSENDSVRKQILNMGKRNYIEHKIPKKKLKVVESLEKEMKRKSLTPQNSFEEVYHEKEDFKRSKCNRTNEFFESNNDKSIEFSKYCMNQSVTRESTNSIKIVTDVTSEKPSIVRLECDRSNKIENRLKNSQIEFKDKSSLCLGTSQTNLENSYKFSRTDCFQNRKNTEEDKKIAVAVTTEIAKETMMPNRHSTQIGSFEFDMTILDSVSSEESQSIVDEVISIEDGEIVDTSFVENLNIKDTKSKSKLSVENNFKPILDDKESCGSLEKIQNNGNKMYTHVDISKSNCEKISKNNETGVKNPEYEVESIENILSAAHHKKEQKSSCVLKTNNLNNVDNVEITSDRSNISLLDTVEDKVTKYSDMKNILQQTLSNNCESAGDQKKQLDNNGDCVPDGQKNEPVVGEKITVLSNIVLTTNTNIAKEIINCRKIDVTSNLSETVNLGSKNQGQVEHESLVSLKNEEEEINKLIEIDGNCDTKGEMENCIEISKVVKIIKSTRIKREVSGAKNSQENSLEKQNKLITKLPIDRIEHETFANILNGPFDHLSDSGNYKSLALLKTSGCKSKSLENIKDENPDMNILLDNNKKLPNQLVSTINKSTFVDKIEDANISNRQISDSNDKHSLQDHNKSIGQLENLRDNYKSLVKLEDEITTKIDSLIKSSSDKLDVASCESKLLEKQLDNSTVRVLPPSDSNVLEGYQKSLLEEFENPSKDLIFEKLKNDGCALAKKGSTDKDCKVSEDERSSVKKLEIANCQSIPQNQVDEKTLKSGKVSSIKSRQTNKTSAGKLEITTKKSKSLERVEEQYSKDNSTDYKHSSAKLNNVSKKSKSLNEKESGKLSSCRDKITSSENCKNSSLEKIVRKSQMHDKDQDRNLAKQKSSEKIKNTSSTKGKKTSARKSETTRKKSKLIDKVEDDSKVKKKEPGNSLNIPSDVCKKSSSKKLETDTSKSQLALDKNSDKSELDMSSTNNNTIPEDNKKSSPGNLEVTISKLKSPGETLDYGNITIGKKKSFSNSKDNSDNNEQPSDKLDENICQKKRNRQKDSVVKLPELETRNVANILDESIEKSDELCVDQGALDTEKRCDIKSEIHNNTILVKGENIENDKVLSSKITDKHEVLDEKEIAEKGASKIHSEPSNSATPTKPLKIRRITPTPVKDTKQVCSFANILEKNHRTTFPESSPLHLTDEGEIPILHIEENNFNTVRVEEAFKIGDGSIMKLLDTMHLSNMDSELSKFTSNTDNLDTTGPLNQSENRVSFDNIMDKITPDLSESDLTKTDVSIKVKTTEDTCKAVGNTSTGNRKRRRLRRVIVLE